MTASTGSSRTSREMSRSWFGWQTRRLLDHLLQRPHWTIQVPPDIDPQWPSRVPSGLDGAVATGQRLPGGSQEPAPGLGELHAMPVPGEQPYPEFVFQPGDALGQRLLSQE
jgi:hypothetical protein